MAMGVNRNQPSMEYGKLEDQEWYWGNVSKYVIHVCISVHVCVLVFDWFLVHGFVCIFLLGMKFFLSIFHIHVLSVLGV